MIKSDNDKKQYQLLQLQNGIEVMLVSTMHCPTKSTHSAAACAVQVGSFSDPEDVQGLAHFVEHMVFMGSKTYPIENYYDSFIHSHGGECNAMTEGEFTVYQFNVATEHFSSALDIFANCLLYPLFTPSAMERELNAIESEFSLALSDDGARLQQLLGKSSIPNHVLGKFSWGNEYSLKTIPQTKSVDVVRLMKVFHASHYIPSHMKLVLISPKSLQDMEADLVKSTFYRPFAVESAAATMQSQESLLAPLSLPLPSSSFRKVYRVIPTRKTHKLLLSWQMESQLKNYRSKSVDYMSHLLGHEGPGSLLSELKRLGYSSGVSAGVSGGNMDNNSMFSLFNVTVILTPKGLANWFSVCSVLFAYLAMLEEAGPQEWIYKELQTMAEIDFAYLEEEEEEEFAETLVIEMLPYKQRAREDLLAAHWLYYAFVPSEIAALTKLLLDPTAARVEILSSSYYMPGRVEAEGDDPETEWEDADDDDDEEDDTDDEEGDDYDEVSVQCSCNALSE